MNDKYWCNVSLAKWFCDGLLYVVEAEAEAAAGSNSQRKVSGGRWAPDISDYTHQSESVAVSTTSEHYPYIPVLVINNILSTILKKN